MSPALFGRRLVVQSPGSVETPTERGFNVVNVMTINRVERNERLAWKRYSVFLESRGLRRGQAGI